jgi:nitroimidazol reductase NimA-like FMN-containing flavoprotein (pyridoxamine 5'-phosphate oxidase superfamily)
VTPVHFVLLEGRIYIHGLANGTRLQNLRENPRVCFETAGPHSYLQAETPCDTNTAYQSVIVLGTATVVEAREKKIRALEALVAKYTPQHVGKTFP